MGALLDLLVASSIPIGKVLLITGLGSYLALDSVNILGDYARKHVNNVTFFVFNPSLVYSNLAKTITYESMLELWFMPFNVLITFLIGSVLGWVVVQLARPPSHLRGLVISCCAAGNLGNLLLIIIPAVCKEKGSPFGDPKACHTYGMAYASLSMAIGAIFLWSYVYNIVRVSSNRTSMEVEISDSPTYKSSRVGSPSSRRSWTDPLLSSEDLSGAEDHENGIATSHDIFVVKPRVSALNKIKQQVETLFNKMNLKKVLAPSTTAAITGFVIGLIPQIRNLLIGESAPLRVVQDSIDLLGDGAIPAVTLVMGGNLLKGLKGGSEIRKSIIFSILCVRYIVLPLIGIGVVKGAVRFGLVRDNPLYQFVLLLQFAVPPAMNIGTITQLFGAGESECSVIMLWCYSLASVSLTLWSTLFLWLVSS